MNYLLITNSETKAREKALTLCSNLVDVSNIDDTEDSLGINSIRSLKNELRTKQSQPIGFFISKAWQITIPAQNSFLKLLEEPPTNVSFFIWTRSKEEVLPTIVSRCIINKIEQDCETVAKDSTIKAKELMECISSGPAQTINFKNKYKKEFSDNVITEKYLQYLLHKLRESLTGDIGRKPGNNFASIPVSSLLNLAKSGNEYLEIAKSGTISGHKLVGLFMEEISIALCTHKNN